MYKPDKKPCIDRGNGKDGEAYSRDTADTVKDIMEDVMEDTGEVTVYILCCVGNYHLPSFQSLHETYRQLRVDNIIPLKSLEANHVPHQNVTLTLDFLQPI